MESLINFRGKFTGKRITQNIVDDDYKLVKKSDVDMNRLRR